MRNASCIHLEFRVFPLLEFNSFIHDFVVSAPILLLFAYVFVIQQKKTMNNKCLCMAFNCNGMELNMPNKCEFVCKLIYV